MNSLDNKILISLCPDPVIGTDRIGTVSLFNPAAEKLFGYKAEEVVGKHKVSRLYAHKEVEKIKEAFNSNSYGKIGTIEGFESSVIDCDGSIIPIRLSASIVDHELCYSIGFFHDLTEKNAFEEELRKRSITDDLTGLYNQRHFHKVLAREIERTTRYHHQVGIICFDIDHFKQINDLRGHLAGDDILRCTGRLLKQSIRLSDIAFRYGGDEFMVILPETKQEAIITVAERIRNTFNNHCPFSQDRCPSDDNTITAVTISIGMTGSIDNEKPEDIIHRADLAMYRAKHSGGNCSVLIRNDEKL